MCWLSSHNRSDGPSPNLRRLLELRGEICAFPFSQAAICKSRILAAYSPAADHPSNHWNNSSVMPTRKEECLSTYRSVISSSETSKYLQGT
ncbi:hypothetical protein PBY51_024053 [Eleginops maclovinus]|uniref:Uncharacterized protein n=1 Tax=Eleginops maclovinus TaxID=56733 RepID=A0AAN7XYM9_ELEMC|nr:hypothetical protein PBY51_024053 [Eleginops maclovinus]